MKIGFIGLGQMGGRMARHLANAGHQVAAYDIRSEAIARAAETPGVRGASSIADAARDGDVVCTSLPGPADVEAVVLGPGGLKESMRSGATFIDLSTNAPKMVRQLSASLAERGIAMLDAPVSGGSVGAEAATLSVMVGGDKEVFDRMQPVFSAIGTKIFHCGDIGSGAVVKLCNNLANQTYAAIMGEVLTLGVKAGVSLKTLAAVLSVSTGSNSRLTGTFRKRLFRRNFENPAFAAFLMAKDVRLALDLAQELGVPMPVGETVGRDVAEVMKRGWGNLDFDVLVRVQEERTGVTLELAEEDIPPAPQSR